MRSWQQYGAMAAVLVLMWSAGCGDDSTGPNGFPARMYIADFDAPGVFIYQSQYTPGDEATDTLQRGTRQFPGVAVDDAGNLVASFQGAQNGIYFYNAPVHSGAAPSDSLLINDRPFLPTLGAGGRLFVPTQASGVLAYSAPFSGRIPDTLATGTTNAFAVAFDMTMRMFVTDNGNGAVDVYEPPYLGAKAFTINGLTSGFAAGIAFDKDNRLFVADAFANTVVVFQGQLSAISTPAFVIAIGIENPVGVRIGSDGRLYVVNLGGGTPFVTIYDPPFSELSAPTITMSGGGSLVSPYGIAVGPR